MKKKISVRVIILVLFILLIGYGYTIYKRVNMRDQKAIFSEYYQNLANTCKGNISEGCCMSSVKTMEDGGYTTVPENGCPKGYQTNMLKCRDSYEWCEPENLSL